MKVTLTLSLFLLSMACGRNEAALRPSESYQVKDEMSLSGQMILSFDQVSAVKRFKTSSDHSERCKAYAADYASSSGTELDANSLVVSHGEPSKHCARRNSIRQCETIQFLVTITCSFKPKVTAEPG